MSNNNDLPSWLDSPDSGGGDEEENSSAALPPWLQEKPPAPPPPPSEDAGSLPPWLVGDEPPKPKTAMIGGAELSEEYLSAGDRLVDSVDSEITYDEWMAQKYEDERPKSIEEEIPDLLSDADRVAQTGSLGTGSLPHTGQLPDWFLGLDALDERDVPDWFKDAQEIEPPNAPTAPGEVAPWMRDMVQPEAAPAEPPVMPELDEDEVASFFRGMGSPSETDADWFSETTGNEDALPDDDFYAQFGAKPPVAEPDADAWMLQPPPQPDLPDLPDMGSFLDAVDSTSPMAPIEDYELPAEPEPDYDADLPPIELNDDFFTAVAENRERTATESPDVVEDPDLSWFLNMPQTSMLGGETVEESEPAPTQISRPADTGTLSWLNEIQGMVQSATHPDQQDDKPDIEQPSAEDWSTFADAAPSGRAADFRWDDTPEPEEDFTPQEPAPDWLNAVGDLPPDAAVEEEPFEGTFFTPPPVPPPAARLTGMLNAGQLPPDESEMGDEWQDIPVTAADLDWQEITEPGWSTTPAAPEHGDVDEGGVAETDMSEFLRGLNLEPHDMGEPVEEGFSLTNALRDWENPAAAAPLADPEDNFSLTDALRDWNALAADT
ncbi:MAG: hypothetical protein IAE80_22565, partial [Anaerolinea sp.]|nr:hypothetical protein [Anaerolinea sp.]